jgi:hypothetical protein
VIVVVLICFANFLFSYDSEMSLLSFMKRKQFKGVEYTIRELKDNEQHVVTRATDVRYDGFSVTGPDRKEVAFKDVEGTHSVPEDRRSKRKT